MKRTNRFIALLLTLSLLLSMMPTTALTAFAESISNISNDEVHEFTTINGRIIDADGNGIEDVYVQIYNVDEDITFSPIFTNSSGEWEISGYDIISGYTYEIRYVKTLYEFVPDHIICVATVDETTVADVIGTKIDLQGYESKEDDYTYSISGGYATITGYTGTATNILIPEELGGYPVKTIGSEAFRNNKTLEKVYLSALVTSIGSRAFQNCIALTDIKMSNLFTTIGTSAFEGCDGLTEVTLSDSVQNINDYAFRYCDNLVKINYPKSWKSAGNAIFGGCAKLTSIVVPEGVTSIPSYAFYGMTSLTNITLPSTLTNIGYQSFQGCSGLVEVTIPDSVHTISDYAFRYCENLEKINYPKSWKSAGDAIFGGCTKLTSIVVPEGVTSIPSYAFYGMTSLTNITLPSTLTNIGYQSFQGCSGLVEVTIPDSVHTISDYAFRYCENLEKINYPKSWKSAGNAIFGGCTKLTSIVVPEGVTSIPSYAFYGMTSLTNITLPSTLTNIGYQSFQGCSGLVEVTIPDSVHTISDYAFRYCENLEKINYPKSWKSAGDAIFGGCKKLTTVTIPEGVTSIPSYAFYGANELREIYLPSTVKKIGAHAFESCSKLRKFHLNPGLQEIGDYCFRYCSKLLNLIMPESIAKIGEKSFYGCDVLTVFCPESSAVSILLIDDNIPFEFIGNSFKELDTLALDRDGTYYVSNTVGAMANGYVTMNLSYSFKDSIANEISDMTLTIRMPRDLALIEKTLMLDGVRLTGYEFEDNVLSVDVKNTSGQISFCLNPSKDGKVTTYAVIDYKQNNVWKEEIIGVLNDEIPLLSIQADSEVNTDTFSVSGVGPADTDVSIYIDGALQNTVHTNKSGSYSSKVTISNPKNYQTYKVVVKSTTEDGEATATKEVKYCELSPTVQNFTMNYNGNSYNLMEQGTAKPTVTFASGEEFNFNVKFTNPEQIDKVYVCSTRSNVTKRIEAIWNEATQSYVANGLFDPSNASYVPGTITVEYSPIRDPINFLTGNIDYTADKYVNGASDPIRAALAGKLEDCIEDLESDDNKVSGIIKLVDVNTQLNFNIFTDIIPSYLDPENAGEYGYEAIEDDLGVKLYLKVAEDVDGKISGTIVDFATDKLTDFCIEGGYIDLDMAVGNYFAFVDALGYMDKMITWDNNRVSINESKQAILSSNMSDAEKAEALKKLDYASKSNNGVVAAMALQIILSVAGVAIPFPASMILPLLSMKNSNYVDGVLGQFSFLNASETDGAQFTFRWAIDPSGYVYEGVTDNRIEGVKTTVYHIPYDDTDETFWDAPKTENAQLWDASEWDQVNPLYTDADGKYAWDVPEGWWQVKYEKEGYETTYSEWLPVPPPQTEVNIGLTSTTTPTVEGVEVNDGSVVITFSQYIDPDTFAGVVLKDADDNSIQYTVEYSKDETDLDGNVFAKVFTLNIATGTTVASIEVPETITNYAGKAITPYDETFGEEVLYGDVTGDGIVNNKDVTFLRRHLIGGWDVTIDLVAADVNNDGIISNKDVTLLRRYLIGGWDVTLG